MIEILFKFGAEFIEVIVRENSLLFQTKETGSMAVPIEALKLDKAGCLKEHPDLKDREDWRDETIKRLKEKIKKMDSETERARYVIFELTKHGYIPFQMCRAGHRPIRL